MIRTIPTLLLLLLSINSAQSLAFRGTNIGGWLLLENFIVPSFFQDPRIVDEWTYCLINRAESPANIQKLRDHWANFITESDWRFLRDSGANTVRVPIGYWAFTTQADLDSHNEPYLTGQWPSFVAQLKFAKQYGISVILDLHAVPGSQNNFDNSGHTGAGINWGNGDTLARTYTYLNTMAQYIKATENDPATIGAIVGIELINEALAAQLPGGLQQLKNYYLQGYSIVRNYLPANNYYVVIETGFLHTEWQGFMPSPQYQNVLLDIHLYQCFDAGLRASSYQNHLTLTCDSYAHGFLAIQTLPTILGEWSVAYKIDSAHAAGEPYPTADQQTFMQQYVAAQQKTSLINPAYGYLYWTLKTENSISPMWDYELGVNSGWITNNDNVIQAACAGYNTPAPNSVPINYIVTPGTNTSPYASGNSGNSGNSGTPSTTTNGNSGTPSTTSSASCSAMFATLTCRTASEDPTQVDSGKVSSARGWLCSNYPQYCSSINTGGQYSGCNSVEQISYAITQYYNAKGPDASACSFGGIGQVVSSNGNTGSSGASTTNNGASTTNNGGTPSTTNSGSTTCSSMFTTLTCRTASEDPTQVDSGKVSGARSWLCNTYPQYCTSIVSGGQYSSCNSVEQISYAMTQYYKDKGPDASACSFGGIGQIVSSNGNTGSSGASTTNNGNSGTPSTTTSGSSGSTTCSSVFATLTCRTASEDPTQVDAGKVSAARSWLCNTYPQYCTSIVSGGQYSSCNSVEQISYAMSQYYNAMGPDASACSFGGIGQIVSSGASTTNNGNTPSTTTSGTTTCQSMFTTLKCRTTSEDPTQVDSGKVSGARSWLCSNYPQHCTAVNSGGNYSSCNSVEQLSYAMSSYYSQFGPSQGATACDFGGVGHVYGQAGQYALTS